MPRTSSRISSGPVFPYLILQLGVEAAVGGVHVEESRDGGGGEEDDGGGEYKEIPSVGVPDDEDKRHCQFWLAGWLTHLRTKNARPAVRTLMPATMTGQRWGSMVDPDCWKMVVMKKTMVEMPVH